MLRNGEMIRGTLCWKLANGTQARGSPHGSGPIMVSLLSENNCWVNAQRVKNFWWYGAPKSELYSSFTNLPAKLDGRLRQGNFCVLSEARLAVADFVIRTGVSDVDRYVSLPTRSCSSNRFMQKTFDFGVQFADHFQVIMKETAKHVPDAGSYAPIKVLVDELEIGHRFHHFFFAGNFVGRTFVVTASGDLRRRLNLAPKSGLFSAQSCPP